MNLSVFISNNKNAIRAAFAYGIALLLMVVFAITLTNSSILAVHRTPQRVIPQDSKFASSGILGMNLQWVNNGTESVRPGNWIVDGKFDSTDFWVVDGISDDWGPYGDGEITYSLIPEAHKQNYQRIEIHSELRGLAGVSQVIYLPQGAFQLSLSVRSDKHRDIGIRLIDVEKDRSVFEQGYYIAGNSLFENAQTDEIYIENPGMYEVVVGSFQQGLYDLASVELEILDSSEFFSPHLSRQFSIAVSPSYRFPGGSLSDGYHWELAVGDKEHRLGQVTYYNSFYDSEFGTDEFIGLLAATNSEGVITVNFGTGTPEEAARWVNYVRKNDLGENVQYWEIGNEIYGDWEQGGTSAMDFSNRALEFIQAMRFQDKSIKIGVPIIPDIKVRGDYDDYDTWTPTVLSNMQDKIDFLSIHHYISGNDTYAALLRGSIRPEQFYSFVQSENDRFEAEIVDLKDYLRQVGASELPVYITEYGFDFGPGRVSDEDLANAGSAYIVYNLISTFLDLEIPIAQYWTLANDGHFGAYSLSQEGLSVRPTGSILNLFSKYWQDQHVILDVESEFVDDILMVGDTSFSYFASNTSSETIDLKLDFSNLDVRAGETLKIEFLTFDSLRSTEGDAYQQEMKYSEEFSIVIPPYSFVVVVRTAS